MFSKKKNWCRIESRILLKNTYTQGLANDHASTHILRRSSVKKKLFSLLKSFPSGIQVIYHSSKQCTAGFFPPRKTRRKYKHGELFFFFYFHVWLFVRAPQYRFSVFNFYEYTETEHTRQKKSRLFKFRV